ncbi:MAG: hypothetical protein JWO33_2814, partial [Caulobacteraceae bacterium]|nr:hypothetical protein [Caulobacteraceae bacterium]
MKRAVLAIAAAFALVGGAAFAQEGGAPPPPPQQMPELDIQQQPAKKDPNAQAKLDAAAKTRAPVLIAAAKASCTPTDARYVGSFNTTLNGKKFAFDAIEVACQDAVG